ncbi:hypothetical protein BH11MYX3_BH11MYX3_02430 [soil metagenome]
MKLNPTVSLSLLLSVSSACGLIKVNGKPLGGGTSSSSSPSSTSTASEPATTSSGFAPTETEEQYRARQQREVDEQHRKRELAEVGLPAWCKELSVSQSTDVELAKFDSIKDPNHDGERNARDFAEVICSTRGAHRELRPKVMQLRANWMKQHGLDESDFEVVVAGRYNQGWNRQDYEKFEGPIGQIPTATTEQLDIWGSQTSMLARFSYVDKCIGPQARDTMPEVFRTVLCTREPLDVAKAMGEIEGGKDINPGTRYLLRQWVRKTIDVHAKARAEIAARAKEDPGIAQLVAIADEQQKEWTTLGPARTKLLELVLTMEAASKANKNSAFAGCQATTRAAWAEVVKGVDVPKAEKEDLVSSVIEATFRTPEAHLAFDAVKMCAKGFGAQWPNNLPGYETVRRGPRTSTVAAWRAAAETIKFDDRTLSMRSLGYGGNYGLVKLSGGTVESAVPSGDHVKITFKEEIGEAHECDQWKQTGRIKSVSAGGSVNYEHICLKSHVYKTDETPEPVTVMSVVGQGLKPGMYVWLTSYQLPIAAMANRKSTKPVWVLGAPVK